MRRTFGQQSFDRRQQRLERALLGEVGVGSRVEAPEAAPRIVRGREQHHGEVARRRIAADHAAELDARHRAHAHVRDHEIEGLAQRLLDRLLARGDRHHLVACAHELLGDAPTDQGAVVDDEDTRHWARMSHEAGSIGKARPSGRIDPYVLPWSRRRATRRVGGSGRLPAEWDGVVALRRPSVGRPRHGLRASQLGRSALRRVAVRARARWSRGPRGGAPRAPRASDAASTPTPGTGSA